VVANWAAEAARFAPALNVVPVSGTVGRLGQGLGELVAGADAAVTSYTLLRIDFVAYAELGWSGLLLDEAQQAKNRQSKVYQCARRLTGPGEDRDHEHAAGKLPDGTVVAAVDHGTRAVPQPGPVSRLPTCPPSRSRSLRSNCIRSTARPTRRGCSGNGRRSSA
jgi:hypothetical protein